jgi:hypothetical protein
VEGVLFGVAFAALMVGLGLVWSRDGERALFAVVLGAAAGAYAGAAIAVPEAPAGLQAAGVGIFVAWAVLGRDRAGVLAAGWLGHTAWDAMHLLGPAVSGLPAWYELACLVADPLLAGYLLLRLRTDGPGA